MTRQNVYNVDRLYLSITGESVLKKHNGSIFSFIAVGLVLVIATGLIVFAINNRSSADRVVDEVISQTDTEDEKQNDNDNQDEAPSNNDESLGEESEETTEEVPEETPAPESSSEQEETSESEVPAPTPVEPTNPAPATPSAPSANQSVNTAQLPETGLTQDLLSSAIGILAIVGAGYIYYHFGRNQ